VRVSRTNNGVIHVLDKIMSPMAAVSGGNGTTGANGTSTTSAGSSGTPTGSATARSSATSSAAAAPGNRVPEVAGFFGFLAAMLMI